MLISTPENTSSTRSWLLTFFFRSKWWYFFDKHMTECPLLISFADSNFSIHLILVFLIPFLMFLLICISQNQHTNLTENQHSWSWLPFSVLKVSINSSSFIRVYPIILKPAFLTITWLQRWLFGGYTNTGKCMILTVNG